jgi:hypothetical protein
VGELQFGPDYDSINKKVEVIQMMFESDLPFLGRVAWASDQ